MSAPKLKRSSRNRTKGKYQRQQDRTAANIPRKRKARQERHFANHPNDKTVPKEDTHNYKDPRGMK